MAQSVFDLDINKIGNMLQQIIKLNEQIIKRMDEEKRKKELMELKVLSIDQVAEVLKVSTNTAYLYMHKGLLPKRKLGGKFYFYESDIHLALGAREEQKRKRRKAET